MITVEKTFPSGAYVATALVREGGQEWYYRQTYFGYRKSQIQSLYRESVKAAGYTLVKD